MEASSVPKLGFSLLEEAETLYSDSRKIPGRILADLHSVFGGAMVEALELLDNHCKIVEYRCSDEGRSVYKVGKGTELYTVYNNINFCGCDWFREKVLKSESLSCKHILALKLNKILEKCPLKVITVSPNRFVEFLNTQLDDLEEDE